MGVPFALTVDHDSLEDNKVTIRNRDTLKQKRIPISNISAIIEDLIKFRVKFEDIE
ncbi:MAG: His/Gly/Thr/Pro-type tRNA ligase C-terminal domain-containing protein [Methanobacterium sp.]